MYVGCEETAKKQIFYRRVQRQYHANHGIIFENRLYTNRYISIQ